MACDSGAVPTPTGGTIHDGTYIMTSSTFYADGGVCPSPEVDHTEWLICGENWQTAQDSTISGGTTSSLDLNATVTAAGTQVTIDVTCGYPTAQPPFVFSYDADDTTVHLYIGGAGTATSGRVDTLTRQ